MSRPMIYGRGIERIKDGDVKGFIPIIEFYHCKCYEVWVDENMLGDGEELWLSDWHCIAGEKPSYDLRARMRVLKEVNGKALLVDYDAPDDVLTISG